MGGDLTLLMSAYISYHQKTGYRTQATCLVFSMLEDNFEERSPLVVANGYRKYPITLCF
jgi:hypothetical protein